MNFDVNNINISKSHINGGSNLGWRTLLRSFMVGAITIGAMQAAMTAPSQAKGVAAAAPIDISMSPHSETLNNLVDDLANKGVVLSQQQISQIQSNSVDLNKTLSDVRHNDPHNEIIEDNAVFIVTLDVHGQEITSGSGTFVRGTSDSGYPEILTVRHVGDLKNFIVAPKERKMVGDTMIFNGEGHLLGYMSPHVTNLPLEGYNKPTDDMATLVTIDTTRPYNHALMTQISGVPVYQGLPAGEYEASYNGRVGIAAGGSGGSIICDDKETGNWGIIGVVSTISSQDVYEGQLTPVTGTNLDAQVMENQPNKMNMVEQITLKRDDGIIIGIGSPAFLSHLNDGRKNWVSNDKSFANAKSFNFAYGMPTWNDDISVSEIDRPFDYAGTIGHEQTSVSDDIRETAHPSYSDESRILEANRDQLSVKPPTRIELPGR
jgi:hypothetical protein